MRPGLVLVLWRRPLPAALFAGAGAASLAVRPAVAGGTSKVVIIDLDFGTWRAVVPRGGKPPGGGLNSRRAPNLEVSAAANDHVTPWSDRKRTAPGVVVTVCCIRGSETQRLPSGIRREKELYRGRECKTRTISQCLDSFSNPEGSFEIPRRTPEIEESGFRRTDQTRAPAQARN